MSNNPINSKLNELEKIDEDTIQPNIEAETEYVSINIGSLENPINFVDREGYKTKYSSEESVSISKIVK
jgi:hypothetical protein